MAASLTGLALRLRCSAFVLLWSVLIGLLPGCHRAELAAEPAALHAEFAISLGPSAGIAAGSESARAFLAELAQLLPPKIKQRIGRPIVIELDQTRGQESIRVPVCDAAAEPSAAVPPAQTLGIAVLARRAEQPHRILVHPGILDLAQKGSEQSARFACGHGSMYRLALATCLHEVMHIYDSLTQLSQKPAYQHLQQFARQGAARTLRAHNQLRDRSPDVYEFADIGENLAVNGEYFLLDPEFQCRRPAVYHFLAAELGAEPFPSHPCAVNTLVYAGNQPVYLDPARVYQIHYLFAGRGKGIASRFGHSMFRIVRCAANRTQVDAQCLEDLHDHIVLSFVANLRDDLTINAWKGLTGQYRSQLLIRPFTEVLNDYTEIDHRDLQSVPLQLSAAEVQQFIYHALELYWSYSGRYYFLTNNCADESLRLVQSTLTRDAIQGLEILTPIGLRDALIKKQAADASVLADRELALRRGHLFQSAIDRYEQVYRRFRDTLPAAAPRRLERYLSRTKAEQRRQWSAALVTRPESLSGLFIIEGLILQRQMKEVERSVLTRILFKRDPRYAELGQKLKDHLRSLRLPWELVPRGYGIPLPAEFALSPRQVREAFPEEILATAMSLIKIDDAKLYHEYVQTELNRKFMLSAILKSSTAGAAGAASADLPTAGEHVGDGR